jgi:hypothetical protein
LPCEHEMAPGYLFLIKHLTKALIPGIKHLTHQKTQQKFDHDWLNR